MSLTIAAAQSSSFAGDVPRNVAHHLQIASIAADQDVQLLVFPELSLIGYELTLAQANTVRPDSPALEPLRRFAVQAHMTIVAGAPVPNDRGELHIAALAMRPDGSVSIYAKEHVHESEAGVFTSGPGGPTLPVAEATIALAICRDATFPQHAAAAAARGANVYAAGVMITEADYPRKAALLSGYARTHRMVALMANYSGSTGGDLSAGKSALWSEDGQVIAASAGTEESLVIGRQESGMWRGFVLPVSFQAAAS